MVGGLVGADGNAADGVEKLHAVDLQDVGVVLGDDVAVFWIFADDEAADHHCLTELEDDVAAVVDGFHVFGVFVKD